MTLGSSKDVERWARTLGLHVTRTDSLDQDVVTRYHFSTEEENLWTADGVQEALAFCQGFAIGQALLDQERRRQEGEEDA